ncbi:DUF6958 family protein [Celeribacter sp.]|uniref:DUF6958 family protein n=1 Tax=Celeribacter sp. TaxID=1890673 RepID=UPI003A8E8A52
MADKIDVENINTPGKTTRVDAAKYTAMKTAMLAVVPKGTKGLTAAQIKAGILPLLPDDLFPAGATAGWWLKCVQLDLEAKGVMIRHATKPLTFSQV